MPTTHIERRVAPVHRDTRLPTHEVFQTVTPAAVASVPVATRVPQTAYAAPSVEDVRTEVAQLPQLITKGKVATTVVQKLQTFASITHASVPVAVALGVANEARTEIQQKGNPADRIVIDHLQGVLAKNNSKYERTIDVREREIVKLAAALPQEDRQRVKTYVEAQRTSRRSEIDFTKRQLVETRNELTQQRQEVHRLRVEAIKSQVERRTLRQELTRVHSRPSASLDAVYETIAVLALPVSMFTGIAIALTRALTRRRRY